MPKRATQPPDDFPNYPAGTPLDAMRDDLIADAFLAHRLVHRDRTTFLALRRDSRALRGIAALCSIGRFAIHRCDEVAPDCTHVGMRIEPVRRTRR